MVDGAVLQHAGIFLRINSLHVLSSARSGLTPVSRGATLTSRPVTHVGYKGLGDNMGILKSLGALLIVVWVVLWLFVKITFAAIHLLLLIGLAMLVFGFIKRETAGPRV
jgi:hypothetical protein